MSGIKFAWIALKDQAEIYTYKYKRDTQKSLVNVEQINTIFGFQNVINPMIKLIHIKIIPVVAIELE